MVTVKAVIEVIIVVGYNTTGNRDAHSDNIYRNEQFIFQQTSKGNQEVIFQHNECDFSQRLLTAT